MGYGEEITMQTKGGLSGLCLRQSQDALLNSWIGIIVLLDCFAAGRFRSGSWRAISKGRVLPSCKSRSWSMRLRSIIASRGPGSIAYQPACLKFDARRLPRSCGKDS